MAESAKRIGWIDSARGIGILLVVIGHAFRPEMMEAPGWELVVRLIYALHMPLFFVLSGISFGLSYPRYLDRPAFFWKRRAQALLLPLVTFGGLIYLAFWVADLIPATAGVLNSASFAIVSPGRYLYLTLLEENPYASHLWYVWVLFGVLAISFICAQICKTPQRTERALLLLSLPCLLLALLLPLPVMVRKLLAYLFFFAIGLWAAGHRERILQRSAGKTVLMLLGGGIIGSIASLTAFRITPQVGIPLIIQNLALALAVVPVIFALLRLCNRLGKCKPLATLGSQSFAIYLFHQPLCGAFLGMILYGKLHLPTIPVLLICTLCSILLPLLILWIGRKIKLIGRLLRFLFSV